MSDLLLLPCTDELRSNLSDSPSWDSYADELRGLIAKILQASGIDTLEVVDLQVNDPLPDRLRGLRNGSVVTVPAALDLVLGMVAGDGPYCVLVGGTEFSLVSAWDGAVQLHVGQDVESSLTGYDGRNVTIEHRSYAPDAADDISVVETRADDAFWAAIRDSFGRLTMVCERWAHGAFGCRWYLVTPENIRQVAAEVEPRSLVSVVIDPDLQLSPEMLQEGITAFKPPLRPGRLDYRAYPDGADDLDDLVAHGFTVALKDSIARDFWAVVPDRDGVIRARWEVIREDNTI